MKTSTIHATAIAAKLEQIGANCAAMASALKQSAALPNSEPTTKTRREYTVRNLLTMLDGTIIPQTVDVHDWASAIIEQSEKEATPVPAVPAPAPVPAINQFSAFSAPVAAQVAPVPAVAPSPVPVPVVAAPAPAPILSDEYKAELNRLRAACNSVGLSNSGDIAKLEKRLAKYRAATAPKTVPAPVPTSPTEGKKTRGHHMAEMQFYQKQLTARGINPAGTMEHKRALAAQAGIVWTGTAPSAPSAPKLPAPAPFAALATVAPSAAQVTTTPAIAPKIAAGDNLAKFAAMLNVRIEDVSAAAQLAGIILNVK